MHGVDSALSVKDVWPTTVCLYSGSKSALWCDQQSFFSNKGAQKVKVILDKLPRFIPNRGFIFSFAFLVHPILATSCTLQIIFPRVH